MGTPEPVRPTLSFGAYELDLQLGVLRKNGIRLRCQEQPLQVLAALVERAGELVTREELRRRVWPRDTFVDFDHALNTAIKKIRATLNDDADAPRYIETVPRRGYRFVAPVGQQGRSPALAPPGQSNRRAALLFICIGAFLLAILGITWRLATRRHTGPSPVPEFQRLTFDMPGLGEARFTPDGASVVYSGRGQSDKLDIYLQRLSAGAPQSLGMSNFLVLALSRQGDLAVLSQGTAPMFDMPYRIDAGILARVPLGGGAPRDLLPNVEDADWSPNGQLAVVRHIGHKRHLEFPIGNVLYESGGWISSPRFSPAGDSIAFLDHPVIPDDRGSVILVDLKGTKRILSGFWESLRGLAWSPRGNELWFAAARSGVGRALYAVALNGRERGVLSVAGGLSLQDISSDGRVLLARDNERLGILFMGPGDKDPRELSWKDWSIAMDISHDGKQLLFDEEGENSGFSYQVGLRPTDGSPPIILGPGTAQSLSPDGNWALSIMPPPDDQIVLLPTGAGTAKTLERGSVVQYEFTGARWFPDSKQIVFVGSESGQGPRCYAQSIEGGPPRAFTPEGMDYCCVSPSGLILAMTEDHRVLLYSSVSSGKPVREFKFAPGEMPSGWTSDGQFLYLSQTQQRPVAITRFDIVSGHRQPWKQIPAPPESIEMKSESVVITPDGQSYAYTYSHHASDLYVVQGLR